MNAPRIAYVINSVEGGGAAQPVPAIASVLRVSGAKVRVFALTGRDRRGLHPIFDADLAPLVRNGGERDHLAAALWLRKVIKDWGATHVWTSLSRATILGLLVAPNLGLPVTCWQHNAYLKPWNKRILRLLQRRARLWVGDSDCVTRLTAERLNVEDARMRSWPLFAVNPQIGTARGWKPGETLRVGSLGRLHPAKGYDVLIEALAQLKSCGWSSPVPFQIEIAGEGAERQRLEALCEQANLDQISFTGFTDQPYRFLAGLHLYVQPSRREGFCIAGHEALATGVPVIASAVGELATTIHDGIGRTVPPERRFLLASALRDMLGSPGDLGPMGALAREQIGLRFSMDRFLLAGKAALHASLSPESMHNLADPAQWL